MNLLRIDHFVITSSDVGDTIRFYTDVLGMELDNSGGRIALKFGMCKINVHSKPAEFLPAAECPSYGSQDICLIASGPIGQIVKELSEAGCPLELGPVKRYGACGKMESIYLRDPDGNLIEIAVYDD